jgi:hypothetical protein
MLNVLEDGNTMRDRTRNFVLAYELYNCQITAILMSIFTLALRNFRMSVQNNDILLHIL